MSSDSGQEVEPEETPEESASAEERTDAAGATAADVPETAADAPDTAASGPDKGRYLVLGTGALAAAALIVAAVFGIQWWSASGSDDLALAQARDEVVKQGGTAVKAYTELDYTNPDAFFQHVIDVSDPTMQASMKASEQNYRQALSTAKTKVTTTVQDIGVEELDAHAGTASLLAAISTQVTQEGQQPTTKPLRLEVQMTRTGSDWKVSGISSVPLVSSGQ